MKCKQCFEESIAAGIAQFVHLSQIVNIAASSFVFITLSICLPGGPDQ